MDNIYKKINAIKLAMSNLMIEKTGRNEFARYDYFELADFANPIIKMCCELGVFTSYEFTIEKAILYLINCDDPSQCVTVTIPWATASLKGAHEIQNRGAEVTYMRRYLLSSAFEITEHDGIDSQPPKQEPKPETPKAPPKPKNHYQVISDEIMALNKKNGDVTNYVGELVRKHGGARLYNLTESQQTEVIQAVRTFVKNEG